MTFERALELILGNLGVLVLLLFILLGGARGMWVYGRYYDKEVKRGDALELQLREALRTGRGIAHTADRAVTRLTEGGQSEAQS